MRRHKVLPAVAYDPTGKNIVCHRPRHTMFLPVGYGVILSRPHDGRGAAAIAVAMLPVLWKNHTFAIALTSAPRGGNIPLKGMI